MMKSPLIAFLLLLFSGILHAQPFTIDDIPLKWKNFTVKKEFRKHPYSAKIATQLPIRWATKIEEGKTRLSIYVKIEVNEEKSWVKEEFLKNGTDEAKEALLNHEKGHYIIACIYYKRLQRLLTEFSFSKRMKPEIDSLYTMIQKEMDTMNTRYDEETNHMNIVEKQAFWLKQLMAEFNELYAEEKKIPREYEVIKIIAP